MALTMFMTTAVPNRGSACEVRGLAVNCFVTSYRMKRSRSRSAIPGFSSPSTTIAFRFFEPITAPGPPRPSERVPSFMMAANRTRFSPAGPMHSTLRRGPCPSASVV